MAERSHASGGGGRSGWRALAWLVLLIIPAATLAMGWMGQRAVGARWVGAYYDPDYQYLLNALNIAEGHAPRHIDHPGTPVQILGAGVLIVRHRLAGGAEGLRASVLNDPESAAAAISAAMVVLHGAALLAFGVLARRLTGSVVCAAAAQGASVASMAAVTSLWRLSPEPLVMAMSLFVACATLMALARPGPARARFAVVSGVLMGIGVASKITFAPVGLLPLWGVRGWRRWAVYILAGAAALVAAIGPILAQTPRMAAWFGRLARESGRYGHSDGHFVVNPYKYGWNLLDMMKAAPVAMLVIGASIVLLAHLRLSGRWKVMDAQAGKAAAALLTATLAEIGIFLLVAKHPEERYLLPGLSLLGVNVCAGCIVLRGAYARGFARCAAGAVLLSLGVAAAWVGYRADRWFASFSAMTGMRMGEYERTRRETKAAGDYVVYFYGSSSPEYALWYADWWTGQRYRADLTRMFPDVVFYNVWGKKYELEGEVLSEERVGEIAAEGKLVFQGPRRLLPPAFEYDGPALGGWEGPYRARLP